MTFVLQLAINGLVAGAIYVLVALSVHLTMRVCRRLDMGLAAFLSFGAYLFFAATPRLGLLIAALLGVLCVSFTAAVEQVLLPGIAGIERSGLLISLGVLVAVQNLLALVFGLDRRRVNTPALAGGFELGGATISSTQLTILLVALLALGMVKLLWKSPVGLELRAIACDDRLAVEYSIPLRSRRVLSFAVSGLLAAIAGILLTLYIGLTPWVGLLPSLKGLTAAIVGAGNGRAVVVCAMAVGLIEHLSLAVVPVFFQDLIVFGVLVAFLLLRPAARIR